MSLQSYREDLLRNVQDLEPRHYKIPIFAKVLGIYEFQVFYLLKEHFFEGENSNHNKVIPAQAIEQIQYDPEKFLEQLPVTSLELPKLLNISSSLVEKMLKAGLLKSFRKKKRRGHLRPMFRMGHLLNKEGVIQRFLKDNGELPIQDGSENREKLKASEQALKEKTQRTKDRPIDEIQSKLMEQAGQVVDIPQTDFKLDPWQEQAVVSLEKKEHIFVQAPTGAGKTAVVEEYLKRNLKNGVTLFYAVPIKALANDKFFDFCKQYGRDKVGINTGDITLNADAPIVVGTTEIVRNILFDRPDAYQVIAYDEAQYLGDKERGGAWEESIIMCSDETLLVFLSGSVANGEVIAQWIEKIKGRKVTLFQESVRPVPLKFAFPYGDGYLDQEDWKLLQSLSLKSSKPLYENMALFFEAMDKAQMTPALLFMPRRRECEDVFEDIKDIPKERSRQLQGILEEHPEYSFVNLKLRRLIVRKGCAYHHSGLLPPEKRVVETLAKRGELRFVSATMSLASGVNFSVRTCFISEYARPGNGGNMQALAPSEILQMWGRAGRRRLDVEGYVVPCMNIEEIDHFKEVEAFPEAIERDDFVSPVNLLSILNRFSVEILEELCGKSLSSFVKGIHYRAFSDPTMFREAGAICASPTYELPPYRQGVYAGMNEKKLKEEFRCPKCENLKNCTKIYEEEIKYNPLQKMVKHLKMNQFLTDTFSLTAKGRLAERFHSEAGLLVAHHIVEGKVRPSNLVHYAATVSAPGHIDFLGSRRRLYLDIAKRLYPIRLFPNLWENQRGRPVFVNWNPGAGTVAEEWLGAKDWESFSNGPRFKHIQGDVFRMLLRTGELLRSMSYVRDLYPEIAEAAKVAVKLLMRPPLIPEELFGEN